MKSFKSLLPGFKNMCESSARYYKTDGQNYCVSMYVMKDGVGYLHACLLSWTQKEIAGLVSNLAA